MAGQVDAMGVRVAAVGLGEIGRRICLRLLQSPEYELIGAVDVSPSLVDQPVMSLFDTALSADVHISGGIASLGAGGPNSVAVHATGSRLSDVGTQIMELAHLGWNVVSTCEELAYPWIHPEIAGSIDEAAKSAGVSVLGAGINPGFLMDTLPALLCLSVQDVESMRVSRVVDVAERRPALQRKTGVGLSVEEFEGLAQQGRIGHVGLRESAWLLCSGLGVSLESYEEQIEPVIADQQFHTAVAEIPAGGVIGQRQVAVGHWSGRAFVRLELEMSVGAESADVIQISSRPPIRQVIRPCVNGDEATVSVTTNLAVSLPKARPGLLTMRDMLGLPLGRAVLAPAGQ